jgi:hypothetical protein
MIQFIHCDFAFGLHLFDLHFPHTHTPYPIKKNSGSFFKGYGVQGENGFRRWGYKKT